MMMAKRGLVKKGVFFLIFTWRLVSVAGQQGPVDLILLLDTSASVSGSYREVRDYVTGPFLKEYLRLGDTFHIISFSDKPRLEIARRIEGQGDLEAIIGRVFLLYPLEPGSDIVGALAYLETYLSQLSPSKPKKVVLISDGEMAPELPGAGGIENLMGETKKRLAGKNASFDFIRLPLKVGALPSSGRGASVRSRPAVPALVPPSANAPPSRQPVPSPPTEAPPAPGAEVPAMVPPSVAEPPVEELSAAQEETPPAPEASSPQPASAPPAAAGGGFELPAPPVLPPSPAPLPSLPPEITASDPPVEPAAPASAPGGSARKTSFPFILLALPVLAILGFAVFFLGRRLQESPGRAVARAANLPAPVFSPTTTPESALAEENAGQPPRLDGGPIMLNLFVEDQNTFIGKRNIHVVKPGVNFTIGGGQSDFLIFLVPMPSRIADLRYEDGSCLLIPRKPKYFPDTGSSPVKDCIGKTIRVVSDKDYELFMRIELYEDPLAALNRLMNSVRASPANPRF